MEQRELARSGEGGSKDRFVIVLVMRLHDSDELLGAPQRELTIGPMRAPGGLIPEGVPGWPNRLEGAPRVRRGNLPKQ